MTVSWQRQLEAELQAAGATDAEIQQLMPIAAGLRQLPGASIPSAKTSNRKNHFQMIALVPAGLASLLVVITLVLVSQSALPTSMLYPLQKFSDAAAADINPEYKQELMMKRAWQVNELARRHAGSNTVLAALHEYNNEAKAFNNLPKTNPAAYEFCETNLREASKLAAPNVRQAIESSLKSMDES